MFSQESRSSDSRSFARGNFYQYFALCIAPSETYYDYTDGASYAVVKDVLHIFGGYSDKKKVAKLDGCAFVELAARMNFDVALGSAALAIEQQTQALICFDWSDVGIFCDLFDGVTIMSTFSTRFSHGGGSLGFYEGKPTTVGSEYKNGFQKTETLTSTGWISLADHPYERSSRHSLVGLQSGALLAIGGANRDADIWKLSQGSWSALGKLKESTSQPSSILIDYSTESSIYVIGGSYPYMNQRIDLEAEIVKDVEIIGEHGSDSYAPVIYHAAFNYCVQV